jgi:hypothetical protein
MACSVVEFNSKMGAAGCSEVLGKFVPDSKASHHITEDSNNIRNICWCNEKEKFNSGL